jgi:hypothetical protein
MPKLNITLEIDTIQNINKTISMEDVGEQIKKEVTRGNIGFPIYDVNKNQCGYVEIKSNQHTK